MVITQMSSNQGKYYYFVQLKQPSSTETVLSASLCSGMASSEKLFCYNSINNRGSIYSEYFIFYSNIYEWNVILMF